MRIRTGYCGVCDTTQIWELGSRRAEANSNYDEFFMYLSNNSLMRTSVCKGCKGTLDNTKVLALFTRIQDTWFDEMVGSARDEDFTRMRSLQVLSWGLTNDRNTHTLIG